MQGYLTEASPRNRGWTVIILDEFQYLLGFPAQVGMNRGSLKCRTQPSWLPRAGGDEPGKVGRQFNYGLLRVGGDGPRLVDGGLLINPPSPRRRG